MIQSPRFESEMLIGCIPMERLWWYGQHNAFGSPTPSLLVSSVGKRRRDWRELVKDDR
ncbi:hypothetical protein M404DRAFT_993323 [Pisolithus tinctorius Marx 270]|uniref:Uncharacterized protein n=1 Tax=Pisolithus tinctorius Marx 270 TaxID=870435 RepID=A0A0C3PEQ8_PISTI|nr:hypothetical protein M404DRAFT_993323 [Pisolithus tinctorius Marx 270]